MEYTYVCTDWIGRVKIQYTVKTELKTVKGGKLRIDEEVGKLTVNDIPASRLDWLMYSLWRFVINIPEFLLKFLERMEYKCSCGWQTQGLRRRVAPLILKHMMSCKQHKEVKG